MMKLLRLGLLSIPGRPCNKGVHRRTASLGVEALLKQEGIPHTKIPRADSVAAVRQQCDALVLVGHAGLTETEQRKVVQLMRSVPTVWIGTPPPGEVSAALGLKQFRTEQTGTLLALSLSRHPLTRLLKWQEERSLKLKYIPYVIASPSDLDAKVKAVGTLGLSDGLRLGPAVLARSRPPKCVAFLFPLGEVFAFYTGSHYDMRHDLDLYEYPLQPVMDALRTTLREAVRFVAPEAVLLRAYYWRPEGRKIPTGCFLLNHDLCGFSREGLRFIKRVCQCEQVRTTFFDLHPFRLTGTDAPEHDVELHALDSTPASVLRKQRSELEAIQGKPVLGWRRHGSSQPESFPSFWRRAEAAGLRWTSSLSAQSTPWLSLSEGSATGNRLPYYVVDGEKGRELDVVEVPSFDTQDAERLSGFGYGCRLPWDTWESIVRRRLDYTARHNLLTGYLIHGWTAGVEVEDTYKYGARDCQRMMELILHLAKERGLVVLGHDELYEWWQYRAGVRCEIGKDSALLSLPDASMPIAVELFPPPGEASGALINGRKAALLPWSPRSSVMIVVEPAREDRQVELSLQSRRFRTGV